MNHTHGTMSAKKAFELIKEYFLHPPILVPPQHGKPLLLYLSIIGDAVGSMLAQEDNEKNERVIYYLSMRFHDYKTRYTPIEKSCGVLSQATKNKTYTPKNICSSASKDRSHGEYLA